MCLELYLFLDVVQEVQALAAVGAHPNIVQYYSAWAEPDMQGDQLYIQMELCGDSLAAATRLREQQPWREPELKGLLKQVGCCLGLGQHSQPAASCYAGVVTCGRCTQADNGCKQPAEKSL